MPKRPLDLEGKIKVNKVQCRHCSDVIESTHRHDFQTCKCGRVSVDGGKTYLRRLYVTPGDFIELSENDSEDLSQEEQARS